MQTITVSSQLSGHNIRTMKLAQKESETDQLIRKVHVKASIWLVNVAIKGTQNYDESR